MKEHIEHVTDLLLGAAYADKRLEGQELEAIRGMLTKILGVDALPEDLQARIKAFNPAKFDLAAAASVFQTAPEDRKRKMLDLIASVNESDDVTDLDEDAYLRKVAKAMGMKEEEIADLTVEVLEEDDLEGFFDAFEE